MVEGSKTSWSFQYYAMAVDWAQMPVSLLLLISPGHGLVKSPILRSLSWEKPWHFQRWLSALKLFVLTNLSLQFSREPQTVRARRGLGDHREAGRPGKGAEFPQAYGARAATRARVSTLEPVFSPGHQVALCLRQKSYSQPSPLALYENARCMHDKSWKGCHS